MKAMLHQFVSDRAAGASTTESHLRSLVTPRRLAKRVKVAAREVAAVAQVTRE